MSPPRILPLMGILRGIYVLNLGLLILMAGGCLPQSNVDLNIAKALKEAESETASGSETATSAVALDWNSPGGSVFEPKAGEIIPIEILGVDSASKLAPLPSGTFVQLQTLSGNAKFYKDPSALTEISSIFIEEGVSKETLYLRSQESGVLSLAATPENEWDPLEFDIQLIPDSASVAVQINPLTPPIQIKAGQCSPVLAFHRIDKYGNPVLEDEDEIVKVEGLPISTDFFKDANCSQPKTSASVKIPTGEAASVVFYFKLEEAGHFDLHAKGHPSYPHSIDILPAIPTDIYFDTPLSMPVGQCTYVTGHLEDQHGNFTPAHTNISVAVSTAQQSTAIYTDSTCETETTNVIFTEGFSTTGFFIKSTYPQTAQFLYSASFDAGAFAILIKSNPMQKIKITNPFSQISPGVCRKIALQAQDSFGYPAKAPTDVPITLSKDQNPGAFYSTSACNSNQKITQITLAEDQIEQAVYFKIPLKQSFTNYEVVISAAGFAGDSLSISLKELQPSFDFEIVIIQTDLIGLENFLWFVVKHNGSIFIPEQPSGGVLETAQVWGTNFLWFGGISFGHDQIEKFLTQPVPTSSQYHFGTGKELVISHIESLYPGYSAQTDPVVTQYQDDLPPSEYEGPFEHYVTDGLATVEMKLKKD